MLNRLFKHLFTTQAARRRAFPDDSLKVIENHISAGEKTHRAEVRIIIESALSANAILAKKTPRDRALELFSRYGIWDTEENCGVLVYINLADRQVEILADRGIASKVTSTEWEAICRMMTGGFAQGHFHDSTLVALDAVNTLLARHFPLIAPRENQLPDSPVLL